MKKTLSVYRALMVLLIVCVLTAGCASIDAKKTLTKDQVWERLQASVGEYNARNFYQVTFQTIFDFADDGRDHAIVYEYVQHGNNEHTTITAANEYPDFELRYDGTMYWRRSNNAWQNAGEYHFVTSVAVDLPESAYQNLTWMETDDGLVIVCEIPNDSSETHTFYVDAVGCLTKTVERMTVKQENGDSYIQTRTLSIQNPAEETVLQYLAQAYAQAQKDAALPTEPPEVLEMGDLLIRYVAAASSAYRDEAYYVFRGGELLEISVETVEKYVPEVVYKWPDSQISDADDKLKTSQWRVSLIYVPETSQFGDGENWLPTYFGEHWRIYYSHLPNAMEPSDYFLSILPEIVYDFHNGNLDGLAGARTLAYFTIVNTNDGFLVEYLDNLYLWNGNCKLLMEGSRDSGCQYEYYTVITP